MSEAQVVSDGARRPDLILLAGVPGAGKSTALRALGDADSRLTRLDSDEPRAWLAGLFGDRVPYHWYRPVVHLTHWLRAIGWMLSGPRPGRTLIIHHPGTAGAFRGLVARLGRLRGWVPAVIFLDIARDQALAGQAERGRMVRGHAFARHWERWRQVRRSLSDPDSAIGRERWAQVWVSDRLGIVPLLDRLLPADQRHRALRRPA